MDSFRNKYFQGFLPRPQFGSKGGLGHPPKAKLVIEHHGNQLSTPFFTR